MNHIRIFYLSLWLLCGLFGLNSSTTLGTDIKAQISRLSKEDKAALDKVLYTTLSSKKQLKKELYEEFWGILKKINDTWTDEEILELRDILAGASITYKKYIYEDALGSLKLRRPHKSHRTKGYEERLLKLGALSAKQINDSQATLVKIAYRQPVSSDQKSMVYDEPRIRAVITSLYDIEKILDQLFRKSYANDSQPQEEDSPSRDGGDYFSPKLDNP